MQIHAIIEIEEGTLTLTVGRSEGRTHRILKCQRLPLPDLGREPMTAALRSLGGDPLMGAPGVHVVLAERRMQHFVSTVPKLSAAEAVAFVVREALRVAGMNASEGVLVAPQLLRRLPGGRLVIGATALAKNVWDPLQEAFRAAGIAVISLHSMESCMALAAPATGERTAVLDCSSGRARFVLCDGQSAVQVRRFLVGSAGDGGGGALVAQLAMELPRTLDWLRETGHQPPQALVLGTRIEIDAESREMLRGDLERVDCAAVDFELAEDAASPGLATAMLLTRLCADQPRPSLLSLPKIELPWGTSRYVALAAVAVVGLACAWSAVADGTAMFTAQEDLVEVASERLRLEQDLVAIASAVPVAEPEAGTERLQTALSLRRPTSRLLCEVSNCATDAIHLEALQFASTEKVVLTGVVQGDTRQDALAGLAQFAQRLRGLPFLRAGGQEDVSEVAGQTNRFRFRLSLSWRNT